ncbi:MAG: tRNA uridine-5-carboxymethylaminomethyl(34) synthesis GTPase MnmE [Bacteroidales bacterium]|nr:tRNA uridine-5-carboxymethylaminomethyl(34) synthesis GTPase MnmE [Bacteroidales bacterium]
MESQINPNPISFSRDTIVAVSTPPGTGGIAVIRVSGPEAVDIVGSVWRGVPMKNCESHTAHLGKIVDENGEVLDEVVATLFLAPNSYTGEDIIELSCHGSRWIQREIVNLLIRSGARSAGPGEFSQRAFINGRIDLAQAEGIVDLIASNSRAAQRLAMMQANGHFSRRLEELRNQLIDFASLLELELDFSEEDVEFADRLRLMELADRIIHEVDRLSASYSAGKAFKEGIPVVIAGQPNAGKSTLLNLLLEEEKAIVSDVPGTTRDIIEDTREIDGVLFRFIDTAGLRDTDDTVERIGIERATDRLLRSAIILWIVDSSADIPSQLDYIKEKQEEIRVKQGGNPDSQEISQANDEDSSSIIQHIIFNKIDACTEEIDNSQLPNQNSESIKLSDSQPIKLSATQSLGLDELLNILSADARSMQTSEGDIMVTNARHYESLIKGGAALRRARQLLSDNLSADFIAQDVREALHHLGEITGTITTSTLLHSIFSRFCIGK